jgi:hypothetical protein
MAEMQYSVRSSPPILRQIGRPKPIENRSTFMPVQRPTM